MLPSCGQSVTAAVVMFNVKPMTLKDRLNSMYVFCNMTCNLKRHNKFVVVFTSGSAGGAVSPHSSLAADVPTSKAGKLPLLLVEDGLCCSEQL